MSYLALYRKYRPNNFNDMVGQSDIVNIIKNEILNNKLSHAYLFSGPRGTGKTSTAKIIARMINCSNLDEAGRPCGKCESCLNFSSSSDIVEIDAASNNGVDEIRDLRDKVNLVPTYGKYKVYIIDEVHMLTNQAFNALLKTLEEPPAHVIFILATTEFFKIPITVVSRCQKFQFSKFSLKDIVDRLRFISEEEKISVSNEVLYEIARLSDGGLRDAINMLDQLSSFSVDNIKIDDVYQLSGVVSYNDIYKLLLSIHDNDLSSMIELINYFDKSGKSLSRLIDDLMFFLSDMLVYSSSEFGNNEVVEEKRKLIKKASNIYSVDIIYDFIISLNDLSLKLKNSSFASILLISDFIKFSNSHFGILKEQLLSSSKNNQIVNSINANSNNSLSDKLTSNLPIEKFYLTDDKKKIRVNNAFSTASKKRKEKFCNMWSIVCERTVSDDKYSLISGSLKDIEVLVVGANNVIFLVKYDSLLERLVSNIPIIEKLLSDVYKNKYNIVFLLKDEWEYEKNKYILNLKNGVKYNYIDEDSNFIKKEDVTSSVDKKENDIDKIVAILGDNVVSYE